MNEITLSIVLPCYNESENLPGLLDAYKKVISRDDIEIIIVDNGSTDETAQVLQEIKHMYSFLKIVTIEKNNGYGNGIITGLHEAQGKYIGWSHGDLQTPPIDIISGLKIIEDNKMENFLVKGRRLKRPLFNTLFTVGMSVFETTLFGTLLYDINAQPNIFPTSFFKKWVNAPLDFSLDLYCLYMAKKHKLKIVRFPVEFKPRVAGVSKWDIGWKSRWKFIKRTLAFSFKLRFSK